MLTEARQRIDADPDVASSSTKLDLVRCDVASIPMQSDSVDVIHAGASMHSWPEIETSLKEVHRVLVPGGRYFATTFLENFMSALNSGGAGVKLKQILQAASFGFFPSKEFVRDLLVDAGFDNDRVSVEIVGRSCIVIKCEK